MESLQTFNTWPLTTTRQCKEEMLFDRCTWDNDYKAITQKIRAKLLEFAGATERRLYSCTYARKWYVCS